MTVHCVLGQYTQTRQTIDLIYTEASIVLTRKFKTLHYLLSLNCSCFVMLNWIIQKSLAQFGDCFITTTPSNYCYSLSSLLSQNWHINFSKQWSTSGSSTPYLLAYSVQAARVHRILPDHDKWSKICGMTSQNYLILAQLP